MLDAESEQIREVYAMYGLAMYHVQCLERALAMVIATLNPERLTAWDYDARLAENFESTFGQLAMRFAETYFGFRFTHALVFSHAMHNRAGAGPPTPSVVNWLGLGGSSLMVNGSTIC